MKLRLPKGTKDIKPEEKILQDCIVRTLKNNFEKYGFLPLDTPVLERYDILASKYGGGEEILKETFKLKDQGGRKLGLRYDLTVPLARFIAMNPQVKMPFKRFQIGKIFRDGPISSNRIREFLQVDVDTMGAKTMLADAEILALTSDIFKELKIPVVIKLNNRKILDAILEKCNIKNKSVILSIDKLDKIGIQGVKRELKEKGVRNIDGLIKLIEIKSLKQLEFKLEKKEGIKELKSLLDYLKTFNVRNIKLDFSLARGLSYYTSTVFEVYTKKMKESIAGGGRYDKMISRFLNRKEEIPAVGISFGVSRIIKLLKEEKKSLVSYYVIPINTEKESVKIANFLRKKNVKVDIDLNQRGISKNLDYANKLGIPKVVIVGRKELEKKKVKVKSMKTGREELKDVKDLV